ncbi:MAG: heme lyase CcmF/NrfE family subunit [Chloroflexi bacterium]|nr:heme lyase CcmF/NrfE family subunit [Chloroflexota bacterium]
MADIGYIALFLALTVSLYSAVAHIIGGRGRDPVLLASARNAALAVCGLITVSVAALLYALLNHDFQIEYVASYTDRSMSLSYLLSALWAGNDGSLLFWGWLLSIFAAVLVLQKREIGRELVPYAAGVVMFTLTFFLVLSLFIANVFDKLSFVPADGKGLNPLLENPGMFFHPPTLLVGYVGFTIPFAFAVSAMLTRRLGDEWVITVRRWTLITWLFLGIGNLIGAWWAYVELGWGGYWAWDPVENASFMPWLVATAFLHSMMMQRRRGILKIWNMVLVILTFVLSILGTFLTRSGILSSVHTFAESPLLGYMFLAFIGVTLLGAFGLVYYRSRELRSEAEMESLVSRESTFLLNNLLLVGATFAIFVGNFFPIISEAVRGVKISVGPPFFNQVNTPIFLAIVLLAGICTLIGWRQASVKNLLRNFLWPAIIALATSLALFIAGMRQAGGILTFAISSFVLATILLEWLRGSRARHRTRNENYFKAFVGLLGANRPRYGGYMVHIGVVLIAVGVAGSSLFDVTREVSLKPGDSMTINQYILTFDRLDRFSTETRDIVTASISVSNGGTPIGRMSPEKYFHRSYDQPVTEVAIRSTIREDLYIILVDYAEDDTTAFKIIVNPLVRWLWIGGIVLVLGGLFAFWPEGRRQSASAQRE